VVWTVSGVERVPAGHIVHFILDAVEQLPITDFRVNERGSGSEQYPPRMMLALLR
jgi:transposase